MQPRIANMANVLKKNMKKFLEFYDSIEVVQLL